MVFLPYWAALGLCPQEGAGGGRAHPHRRGALSPGAPLLHAAARGQCKIVCCSRVSWETSGHLR